MTTVQQVYCHLTGVLCRHHRVPAASGLHRAVGHKGKAVLPQPAAQLTVPGSGHHDKARPAHGRHPRAPPELAEHWDNPGLLVDCGGNVHRVLVTLDITPEVVAEAAAKQCTVIVAHHPVIFDPLKRLCPADVPYQLVRAGISAICMHTNLDAAEGGVNDVLADLFGIRQRTVFADGCGRG